MNLFQYVLITAVFFVLQLLTLLLFLTCLSQIIFDIAEVHPSFHVLLCFLVSCDVLCLPYVPLCFFTLSFSFMSYLYLVLSFLLRLGTNIFLHLPLFFHFLTSCILTFLAFSGCFILRFPFFLRYVEFSSIFLFS